MTSSVPDTKSITAQNRTDAPISDGFSLIGVIEWFLICRAPTLLAGNCVAAYEVPPSATNRAMYATVFAWT